ncbi:hypothetical protein F5Y14DRAFT_429029 [Nemania sp. NC0429]|nr:hypothetical protein F5Y14DRAFT_429029 [Nemania sp. NC0429]
MCLEIVTHTMVCDIRPTMRHPLNPTMHIVDPFTAPRDMCCANATSRTSEGPQCSIHHCCQVTIRSFPCDCGNIVRYHRYSPSKTPSAYTVNTGRIPNRGVWRGLQSLDDLSSTAPKAQAALSEELRVARWGFQYTAAQLGPMAKKLEAASRKKDLKEANLRNGAPYEKQVQAACEELEHLTMVAWDVQTAYYTWMHTAAKFEGTQQSTLKGKKLKGRRRRRAVNVGERAKGVVASMP